MHRLACLLVLLSATSARAQPVRPVLLPLVDSIAACGEWHGPAVGESGQVTAQWRRYAHLAGSATEADFRALHAHGSAVVRAYAFFVLAQQPGVPLVPLIRPHLADTSTLVIFVGCSHGRRSLPAFLLEMVATPWVSPHTRQLSAIERRQVAYWLMQEWCRGL